MNPIKSLLLSSLFTFILITGTITAQTTGRDYTGYKDLGNSIELNVSDGQYLIEPMNEKIIHVTFRPVGKKLKNFCYAVDMKPVSIKREIIETDEKLTIDTEGIDLLITKKPFNISYYYDDKLLVSENDGYQESDTSWMLNFRITNNEVLYGGGARALGMNRRGYRLKMYNKAHYGYETHSELMNYTLPMILSSNRYAILFDNAGLGYLDLDSKKNNTVAYETFSGTPDYHVIAGDNWSDVINQYTLLTGRQPLPPRWAFGNFSSRFGYHSQKETENTVNKFFDDDIPLDAVIIDIYWFGKEIQGSMGNFEWYTDSFPSPQKMMERFAKKGVKTVLVSEPFILTTSTKWKEAVNQRVLGLNSQGNPYAYDFYFGNTGLIDLYKPEARQWFWNIYKGLTQQGVAGWWGDLGEPEVHPADMVHAIGTANEIHNAYGHEWAKLIYEGYQKDFPSIRPFILMRAGYAGSQRYGIIPWSGDVSRSWGGLVPQPEISLQMGMQGIAYMHSDLGGFAGGDKIDDELYIRWLQYGVFQPVFRPHAQEHIPAEPVFQAERTKILAREAVKLRYKLLPYLYTMAFENSKTGYPLMTPLFFHETDNPTLLTYDDAYMWGNALLVAPVKKPGEQYQDVYLPKGNTWVDFFTGQAYAGGKKITVPLSLNNIPVFVKGGSFIPMSVHTESTASYSINSFELHYYADPMTRKSTYSLYNDDGETPDAYTKGSYEIMTFTADHSEDYVKINLIKQTTYSEYAKTKNVVKLMVHNLKVRPLQIVVNGEVVKAKNISWNPITNKLIFFVTCSTTDTEVIIQK
ncbi:MAG: TIM-barrel domain-containing protein [Lentimicrobiaceae bacterium]